MWDDMLRHTELPVLLGKLTGIMWDDMLRHTELPVLLGKLTGIMWDDMLRHTELPVLLGKLTAIMRDDMLRHTELPVLLGKLTAIMWDDMLRHTELPVLLESGLAGLVEPMVWHYLTKFLLLYITESESGLAGLVEPMIWHYLTKFLLPPDIWDKFSKLFPNIWFGSAFKGATGLGGSTGERKQKFQTIRGYAVTGWSRYDHYAVLCELLPQALPSLGICLSVLNKGTFNADLHNGVSAVLKFKSHLPISPFQCLGAPPCDFPGHKVYRDMLDFNHLEASYEDLMHNERHLSSRVQVGSPVTMKLVKVPQLIERDEEPPKPVFEKKPLNWEEDMQLYSRFLDRKEELKADHSTYIRSHPELKSILADFLQFLLLRKPDDVVQFCAEYFSAFSHTMPTSTPYLASNAPTPFPASRTNTKIDQLRAPTR
ncbi:Ciliogenesis-associated TTC17-interacting protein [Mytilus edulis]|uniref:Ciliogenesis-associated TTC17-interacting protein n=1 Tax=Mytilus edulis TaxID=6550 RepID=A0A8S3UH24_MYTED|nr:Ciliogenesis-associated TTC17-interacting protein [Mytilus edulis]